MQGLCKMIKALLCRFYISNFVEPSFTYGINFKLFQIAISPLLFVYFLQTWAYFEVWNVCFNTIWCKLVDCQNSGGFYKPLRYPPPRLRACQTLEQLIMMHWWIEFVNSMCVSYVFFTIYHFTHSAILGAVCFGVIGPMKCQTHHFHQIYEFWIV